MSAELPRRQPAPRRWRSVGVLADEIRPLHCSTSTSTSAAVDITSWSDCTFPNTQYLTRSTSKKKNAKNKQPLLLPRRPRALSKPRPRPRFAHFFYHVDCSKVAWPKSTFQFSLPLPPPIVFPPHISFFLNRHIFVRYSSVMTAHFFRSSNRSISLPLC